MSFKSKIVSVFLLTFIVFLMGACEQNESQNDDLIDTFEHPETKQQIKILHTYSLYNQYIEKVKNESSDEIIDIYEKEIIQPIYKSCFEEGEFLYMADSLLNTPPKSYMELEKMSANLMNREEEINALIRESLIKSMDLLPSKSDITVCVLPSSDLSMSMFVSGVGKVIVPYNRHFTDDYLKISIAHEYHHSAWAEQYLGDNSATVLDNLIFEGKAVMFQQLVYPELESLLPVYEEYDKDLWTKIEGDLFKKDLNRSLEIMFGDGELPENYGYSEGYKMVKTYLDKNPKLTPTEWTSLSAREILEEGNYLENYE